MVPGQVSAPRDVLAAGCSSPRRLPGELAPSPARPLLPPSASAGFAILPGSRRDFESFVLTRPGRELRPGASTRCSSPTSIGMASGRRPPCCNPPASARLGEGQPAEPAQHGACPHGTVPVPMARLLVASCPPHPHPSPAHCSQGTSPRPGLAAPAALLVPGCTCAAPGPDPARQRPSARPGRCLPTPGPSAWPCHCLCCLL